ncbi:MAG TPA: hypothetical protein VKS22_03885 [Candidatus Binataceae bacterium]|nr:hypothetical protein [Candidatus Binataceae bacterium]
MRIATPATLLLLALSGCTLFHHEEPPQQRFLDALSRGNNAEAGQIWLNMNPDDRLNLAHGAGLKSSAALQDIRNQLQQKTEEAADSDTPTPADPAAQAITLPSPLTSEPSRGEP